MLKNVKSLMGPYSQYIFIFSGMVLEVLSLETSQKFDAIHTLQPSPKSMNQKLWKWVPSICILLSPLGDSYVQ